LKLPRSVQLMQTIGIHDFSMTDVQKPEPLRLKRILSALINFARFREARIGDYAKNTALTVSGACPGVCGWSRV
jgi:hypothetical protein